MFHSGWQLLHQPGGEAARGAACTPPQQGRGAAVAFDTSECVQRAVSSLPALHFGALAHVARSRQAAGRSQPQSSAVALRGACLEGEARSLLSPVQGTTRVRIIESCANLRPAKPKPVQTLVGRPPDEAQAPAPPCNPSLLSPGLGEGWGRDRLRQTGRKCCRVVSTEFDCRSHRVPGSERAARERRTTRRAWDKCCNSDAGARHAGVRADARPPARGRAAQRRPHNCSSARSFIHARPRANLKAAAH